MITTMEEQLYSFCQFPGSKNHLEEKNNFSNFLFQEMSLKREIFFSFLHQNFMKNYGISSAYVFCNFFVSENFGMSPVYALLF